MKYLLKVSLLHSNCSTIFLVFYWMFRNVIFWKTKSKFPQKFPINSTEILQFRNDKQVIFCKCATNLNGYHTKRIERLSDFFLIKWIIHVYFTHFVQAFVFIVIRSVNQTSLYLTFISKEVKKKNVFSLAMELFFYNPERIDIWALSDNNRKMN